MAQSHHANAQSTTTESALYLPAGETSAFETTLVDDVWSALFNNRV
ncbi:hypothetical protein [Halogeometricum limi]|uniref:Uncharacterized protein n=1 Tax=Halogeometricum limi TaxID=555875 RepID=A0A1I6HLN6_9EURY|nr:hypothetical protein [Halogeometricum limi]SFR55247.1 hypothetical protein SAMN04488124_2366 [Halogeometricum limi]